MNKTTWLEIEPVDTLFFRGAESMEAGENHEVDTMFPPMPATITGAIRTAILRQRSIAPADYLKEPDRFLQEYPLLGTPQEPGFILLGPLFMVGDGVLLLPAPAHWYADLPNSTKMEWGKKKYPIQTAAPLAAGMNGLTGSVNQPFWVHQPEGSDMKSLNGYWATKEAFDAMHQGKEKVVFCNSLDKLQAGEAAIFPANALFDREERVGIALTPQRTAKDGHLYSAVHIRMRNEVRLVVGLSSTHQTPLESEGILQLGGEQRVCRYHVLPKLDLPTNPKGNILLAISPLEISQLPPELAASPRASGKLLRIGGWDMEKRFHKPMSTWLPTGTVIAVTNTTSNLPQCLTI